jgi:hypothetical protein
VFEGSDARFLIVDVFSVGVVLGIELNEGIVEFANALPLNGIDALLGVNFFLMA